MTTAAAFDYMASEKRRDYTQDRLSTEQNIPSGLSTAWDQMRG